MKLTPTIQPRQLSGEGFPNGLVAAPVGSIYTDVLATNGAIRWVKTVGTGTGGWSVLSGSTGEIQLYDSTSPPEWGTASSIIAIRDNNDVTITFTAWKPGEETSPRRVMTIPFGLRPDRSMFSVPLIDRDNRPHVNLFDISSNGEMVMHHLPSSTGRHYGSISWRCSSAWPIV